MVGTMPASHFKHLPNAFLVNTMILKLYALDKKAVHFLEGRVQKPQARKLSVGGVPPPWGLHGRNFSEKLAEKR